MSKDIWHKPSETTDVDNNLIIDDWTNGTYELGYFDDNDMIFRNFRNDDIYDEESMMRWCDVDELIDDYNRTRKALEVATGFIKGISQTVINDCDNQYVVLGNFKKFAEDTLNKIKTAEKITVIEE